MRTASASLPISYAPPWRGPVTEKVGGPDTRVRDHTALQLTLAEDDRRRSFGALLPRTSTNVGRPGLLYRPVDS